MLTMKAADARFDVMSIFGQVEQVVWIVRRRGVVDFHLPAHLPLVSRAVDQRGPVVKLRAPNGE
jgi:hypothetical protein